MKLKYYIDWAVSTWFGLLSDSGRYSKEWDKKLNQILDTGDFEFDEYLLHYKNIEVWVSNRFYCYGYITVVGGKWMMEKHRPKVSTMVRLAMLQDEWIKENVKTKKQTTLDIIRSIEIGELK